MLILTYDILTLIRNETPMTKLNITVYKNQKSKIKKTLTIDNCLYFTVSRISKPIFIDDEGVNIIIFLNYETINLDFIVNNIIVEIIEIPKP